MTSVIRGGCVLLCVSSLVGACKGRELGARQDALIAEQAASSRVAKEAVGEAVVQAKATSPVVTQGDVGRATPRKLADALDADMRRVLDELASLGGKPTAELSAADARKQPTPTDAVLSLLRKNGETITPPTLAKVENRKVSGAQGQLDARIYTPPKNKLRRRLPVIAYWHGGGFVIANLDVYDASARALAARSQAIVVSFDYRRAPEHKFPAAHEDALAEYQWLLDNAASLGGDPKRIAVAGESAGGNLAMNVAIAARDRGKPRPKHQLLIYPVASSDMTSESYQEWADAKPLNKAMMQWFFSNYLPNPAAAEDVRINLLGAQLSGLPPTTVILAEVDPLHSEGGLLARKLLASGVDDVQVRTYMGVTHEFFGMGAAVEEARAAQMYAGERLRDALK